MNFRGLLALIVCIIASVYTSVYGGYKYVNYSFNLAKVNASTTQTLITITQPQKTTTPPAEAPAQQTNNNTQNSNSQNNNVITVSATGTAIGKIISEFLSPYGANTSYGNVFIKNSTSANIDIAALLNKNLGYKIKKNSDPQVLIVHTHTTETYIAHSSDYYTENDESRTLDENKNMVHIGNIFEQKLSSAGIAVLHDKTVHDHPSYTGSYSRSYNTVTADLKAYPSVKIVIDIHRDALANGNDKIKPVVNINGQNSAQVMLVMGSQTGSIKNFPNWQENLSLAVKYQNKMEEMYPGLARALMLNEGKYNQHIMPGSILLEVGSDANTLTEAETAAQFAAEALISTLETLK